MTQDQEPFIHAANTSTPPDPQAERAAKLRNDAAVTKAVSEWARKKSALATFSGRGLDMEDPLSILAYKMAVLLGVDFEGRG